MGHAALERLILACRHETASLHNYEDQIFFGAELQSSSSIDVSWQPVPTRGLLLQEQASPVVIQTDPGEKLRALASCTPSASLQDGAHAVSACAVTQP